MRALLGLTLNDLSAITQRYMTRYLSIILPKHTTNLRRTTRHTERIGRTQPSVHGLENIGNTNVDVRIQNLRLKLRANLGRFQRTQPLVHD